MNQCPKCSTVFKVAPDQLQISQGRVRCAHCGEVFDTRAPQVHYAQTGLSKMGTVIGASGPVAIPDTAAQRSVQYDWGGILDTARTWPLDASSDVGITEIDLLLPVQDSPPSPPPPDPVPDEPRPGMAVPDGLELPAPPPPRADKATHASQEAEASASLEAALFKTARPRADRPRRRGLWLACCGILTLVFVLQWAWFMRDQIAGRQPVLRPFLATACGLLQCEIAAPKQIESIAIESSSFTKVQADVYRLSVTFKNISNLALAKPSLEVTLTDHQDQASIRKVLHPRDVGDSDPRVAPGAEVVWSVPVQVKYAPGDAKSSGYRLVAFYP